MFDAKSITQIIVTASITLFLRGTFHSIFDHETHSLKTVVAANLEDSIVRPLPWTTSRPTNVGTPAHKNGMVSMPIVSTRANLTTPDTPAIVAPKTPVTAKVDEKKKKEKAAPKTAVAAYYYPQPQPTPAAPTAPAAAGGGGGGQPSAPYYQTTHAAATGATTPKAPSSMTAAQVMALLFPNGFTQDGMTKLLALRTDNKITSEVYYEVLGDAANSTSPQYQALAVTALSAAPSSEAFTILAQMTEHSLTSTVQTQVTTTLTQYQSTQMMSYLSTPLDSTDSAVRNQALVQIHAGANTVMAQLAALQGSSSGATRTTASLSVQSFFNGVLLQIQTLQKTETNAQNQKQEADTIALIANLLSVAKSVQAFSAR